MRVLVASAVLTIVFGPVAAFAQDFDNRSVVYIECTVEGRPSKGSGVVIDDEGRLLTAKHVIGDGLNDTCKGAIGTQSDPSAFKILRVITPSQLHDIALLQFVEHEMLAPFVPVVYHPTTALRENSGIRGYGFHPGNTGPPDSTPGLVKTDDRDTGGLLGTTMKTTAGMSGGPVIAEGRLVGLIKQEQYDINGQAIETRIVLLDEVTEPQILRALGLSEAKNVRQILETSLSNNDVCTQFVREDITARKHQFPVAAPIAARFIGEPKNVLAETAQYWVTVTTGPAEWIDCRSGNLIKSFYFPMGMVVRPERDVDLIDDGTTRTVFITEHGLRVFIDPKALQPVLPGVGYVFVRSDGAYKLCHQSEANCDPHQEASNKETDKKIAVSWPFMNGYETYLRVPDGFDDIDAAHRELKRLRDFESDPPPATNIFAQHFDLSDPDSIDVCKPRQAYLYSFFSHYDPAAPDGGAAYPGPVTYSLCSFIQGRVANRFERMKIVTDQLAAERFSRLWAVTTMQIVPDNIRAASKALFQDERPIVGRIRCDEPRQMFLTLARASKRSSPFNLSDLIDGDRKRHSVFWQFQVAQARSPVDVFDSIPLFNEIEIAVDCGGQEGNRDNGSIIVDLIPIADSYELPLSDFYTYLRDNFQSVGMASIGLVNRRLREGTVYRICEFSEYVAVRTALYNLAKESLPVQRAREVLDVDLDLMVDHLVHLIMAAAVSTDVRPRTSRQIEERCES